MYDYIIRYNLIHLFSVPEGFIIWQPNCKLPDFDPLIDEAMGLFFEEDLVECMDGKRVLTSIRQDYRKNLVTLVFHQENFPYYMKKMYTHYECCYEEALRIAESENCDNHFK